MNFQYYLSIKKIHNFFKIVFSYFFSNILKKPIRWGFPYSISIEPTNYCNLQCPQCPTGIKSLTRPKGNINFETYKKIINQASPYLLNLFLYFQGEPFLNNEIYKLIEYAKEKNIYTVTSTNGHFFTELNVKKIINSKLDKIIISIDGLTQEVYEQYRIGGSLQKVIKGVENLLFWKEKLKSKKPAIEIQFLVLGTNEHQITNYKLGITNLLQNSQTPKLPNSQTPTIKLKTAQIYDYENGNKFIPRNNKYSRYKKIDNKYVLKKKIKNKCWRMWNSVVITWDGNILPCCFDKDAKYSFGNINNKLLSEIIKNKKFIKFGKQVLKNKKNIDICRNCL